MTLKTKVAEAISELGVSETDADDFADAAIQTIASHLGVDDLEAMGWSPIETLRVPSRALDEDDFEPSQDVLFSLPDGRVKEGFAKYANGYAKDDELKILKYWLANDSCSCCYDPLTNLPLAWMPMPSKASLKE